MSEHVNIPVGARRLHKCLCALAACAAMASAAVPADAQTLPLDDKTRYEKALEEKLEGVLLKLLGPNQAKVVVQAAMDFTRTEKLDVTSEAAADHAKSAVFKWENMASYSDLPGVPEASASTDTAGGYLMPGFPSIEPVASEEKTYRKQMIYPASFVKRLNVTVILDKERTNTEAQNVRTVVTEVLGLDLERGDQLSIIRTPFAPFWKTIWYTPDAVNVIFKYIVLTIMGIIAMIVVSVGFLKLAGAMKIMAQAQQGQQVTMDLGREALAAASPAAFSVGITGPSPAKRGPESAGVERNEIVFNVRLDQVEPLVSLMAGEDPANVALVAGHLEPPVRSAFLSGLPADMAPEVMSHMAAVRFVEADVLGSIRDELERKLNGAVGGISTVVEALEGAGLKTRKTMLERLEKTNPDAARQARRRVLFPEDLLRLSGTDLAELSAAVKIEDLAAALWGLPEELKKKIKERLPETTRLVIERSEKYGAPSSAKMDSAAETLLDRARALIMEGRIENLLDRPAAQADGQGSWKEV